MNYDIDTPIKTKDQDLLNRSNFIEELGKTIINLPLTEQSITIGIMGKWGYGKSSILNMMEEYILNEENIINKPLIFKFNPWYFPKQENLLKLFFDELTIFLKNNGAKKDYTDKLTKYKHKLVKSSPYLLKDLISIKMNTEFLDKILNDPILGAQEELLSDIKKELINSLKQFNRKIIVIIDDIDRLPQEEIKQIFQLVKSLGDFPNLVYILSFDKTYVINSLDIEEADEFIEKIVQIPIEIPKLNIIDLRRIFLKDLEDILKNQNINYTHYELDQISKIGINFFENIRKYKRYLNTLNFYLTIVKNEVDLIDFSIIILIQVFEKEIFESIKKNKILLTDTNSIRFDIWKEKDEKNLKEYCKELKELSKNHTEEVEKLIFYLFPKLGDILKRIDYTTSMEEENERRRRVCCYEHFDSYFTLNLNNPLSKEYLNKVYKLSNDEKQFSKELELLNKNKKIEPFILELELELKTNNFSKIQIQNIIRTLLFKGDDFNFKYNYMTVSNVVEKALILLNEEEQFKILKEIFDVTTNILTSTELLKTIHINYNSSNTLKKIIKLSEEEMNILDNIMSEQIKKALQNHKIPEQYLNSMINRWECFEAKINVECELTDIIWDLENFIYIMRGFIKTDKENNKIILKKQIESHFNIDELQIKIESIKMHHPKFYEENKDLIDLLSLTFNSAEILK